MRELSPAAARWSVLVREFEASGLGRTEFARLKNVNPSTLGWWRSQLKRQLPATTRPAFVELAVAEPVTEPGLTLRLERIAGVLEIPRGVDLTLLRAVVDALC